jgi:protein KRI1
MVGKKKDLFDDDDSSSSSSSSSSSDDSSSTSSAASSASKNPTKTKSEKVKLRQITSINNAKSSDDDALRLTVNKKFATKYQNKKEAEELLQIRQRKRRDGITGDNDGSSESDSSDEEEDEDGDLFTPSVNVQFLKTIKALRKKDAKIYDPTSQFFDAQIEKDDDDDDTKTKARKPQRYKDVVRNQILEQIEDEESGDVVKKKSKSSGKSFDDEPRSKLGYDKEQEELRKAFLTETSDADDNGENEDDWMVVKKKVATPDQDELEKAANEELKEIESISKKTKKDTTTFKDPRGEVGDGEQYLLDFITNKKWIDRNNINLAGDDDDSDDSNDESSLDDVERADQYESNYNFRFEQAAQETATSGATFSVQTYARSQTMDTVRRPDTARKDKRQARKERKASERKAKEEQLRRLKNAKKKEINNKLSQVKAVIGGLEEGAVDEAAIMKMMEGDYDPEKFEKAMEQAYGEDFYEQEDKEWKTDVDVRQTLKGDDEGDALVGQDDENGGMYDNVQEGEVNEDAMEEDYDETEEWNDDAFDDSPEESKLEKKLKTKMQDELYKLDYEDIVAGMPTRFKYREVESNDYGLTTQEILFARDTTLKQFVSLKKMAPYNEQGEFNVGSKKRRKFRELLKKDLEVGLEAEEETHDETAVVESAPAADSEPKKKRRRLKKGKKASKIDLDSSSGIESSEPKNDDTELINVKDELNEEEGKSDEKKKRRRKKNGKKGESLNIVESSTSSTVNEIDGKAAESSNKVNVGPKSSDDKRKKKKKKKIKEKKSSITGISHSRLASYGL